MSFKIHVLIPLHNHRSLTELLHVELSPYLCRTLTLVVPTNYYESKERQTLLNNFVCLLWFKTVYLQPLYLYSLPPIEETIELYTMIFLKCADLVAISIFHSTHNFYIRTLPQILINK